MIHDRISRALLMSSIPMGGVNSDLTPIMNMDTKSLRGFETILTSGAFSIPLQRGIFFQNAMEFL